VKLELYFAPGACSFVPHVALEAVKAATGQAFEPKLIKLHKGQLASDRTSCRSPVANQVRLALHTGAYWLMLALREAIPKTRDLSRADMLSLARDKYFLWRDVFSETGVLLIGDNDFVAGVKRLAERLRQDVGVLRG